MNPADKSPRTDERHVSIEQKRPYVSPQLTMHGEINDLTQSGKLAGVEAIMTGSQL